MSKKQQNTMTSISFKDKNTKMEKENKLKLQDQHRFKMQSKLFENIAAFSSIKAYPCSFIRSFSGTKIKAVDSLGEINSIQMENSKAKKKGYYSTTALLTLQNKWLKALKINAHIPSNMHCGKNDTLKAVSSVLSIVNDKETNGIPMTARILNPARHGFNVLTSFGFIGLMKKNYFDEIVKDMSYKILVHTFSKEDNFLENLRLRNAQCSDLLKVDNLAAFYSKLSFFVRLDEVRFVAPYAEISHKYFIPKTSGAFKVYFKPISVYKCNKGLNFKNF